jgi:teichuronic acid biosynthesis glycosyltransferase TuaC
VSKKNTQAANHVSPSFYRNLARSVIAWLDERGLVTWEHRDDEAQLLMITNIWPCAERPSYGPFVQYTVDGLRRRGIASDVLYVRGYRSPVAYLAGALSSLLLPVAYPRKYLLVHCHGGETSLAGRFFLGGPVLTSYLGTDLLGTQVGGGLRLRLKCWTRSFVLRAHAATMSATTTKSAEMESLLVARARPRNVVIPDGVDRERFHPRDRARARAELGWPAEGVVVLFAGRAEAVEKRLWLAQKAVDLARARRPDIELRIANGVPPGQMPLYYAAADCLLHTSVSEGSPNVVKEALACNLPVVATPSGDVRELLEDVEGCAVCDADAAALAAALLDTLQSHRRSNGRALTEHLSVEAIAGRTIALYRAMGLPVTDGPLANGSR